MRTSNAAFFEEKDVMTTLCVLLPMGYPSVEPPMLSLRSFPSLQRCEMEDREEKLRKFVQETWTETRDAVLFESINYLLSELEQKLDQLQRLEVGRMSTKESIQKERFARAFCLSHHIMGSAKRKAIEDWSRHASITGKGIERLLFEVAEFVSLFGGKTRRGEVWIPWVHLRGRRVQCCRKLHN
mmetsp:Transcript_42568/g.109493  ORF Transcript_42568/g.109493 Transcript_42568/m.109493 type:complete len:184 (-) Transcript_42568:1033-1584(-)